jgi:hypothetical protein
VSFVRSLLSAIHCLTIHWSRRGGRPPYRSQSDALAAPRLSSGVRCAPELGSFTFDESLVVAHARAHARLLSARPVAHVRIVSYTVLARRGSAPPHRPVRDAHARFDCTASMGGPTWPSAFMSPARCGRPRALARTCATNRWPTRAGTPPSGRRNPGGCSSSVAPESAASPDAPHAPSRWPAAGATHPLPDGPSAPYTGI